MLPTALLAVGRYRTLVFFFFFSTPIVNRKDVSAATGWISELCQLYFYFWRISLEGTVTFVQAPMCAAMTCTAHINMELAWKI